MLATDLQGNKNANIFHYQDAPNLAKKKTTTNPAPFNCSAWTIYMPGRCILYPVWLEASISY